MKYGSVCSGIEAATAAWHSLGWGASFFSEIEKFPRAVLAHHYPNTPLHGDFTTIEAGQYEPIDLLVGGTPCQSFSIAGLRGGLGDDRGNLALEYLRLADRLRPRWLVWENVPGVLSSGGGRDFGAILGGMVELGYGIAYRVLDAQYFGVPQRRRRVFVVGYLGDWRRAAAVLLERESLRGDYPPGREARKDVAPTISSRPTGGGGLGTDFDLDGGLVSMCLTSHPNRSDAESMTLITHALTANGFDASEDGTGRGTPLVTVPTLTSNGDAHSGYRDENGLVPVTFGIQERAVSENLENGPQGKGYQADIAYTLEARNKVQSVAMRGREGGATCEVGDDLAFTLRGSQGGGDKPHILSSAVRRLTPRECERLQGFPDDYTAIPYRNGTAADGPRYKALGNSMAVPCMRWIGERIALVDAMP
jgi:DNA (cytosine-5)-methyltransferase 1